MKNYILFILLVCFASSLKAQSVYKNILITNESDPSEVTLAINPTDVNNIVAAANIDAFYYSLDGGLSWAVRKAESEHGVWGDPCIVADTRGNFYYFHLSNSYDHDASWLDRIVCQKSIDGGITWSSGTFTGKKRPHLQDKEWAAVDMTYSPYHNNIYVAWTQCGQTNNFDEGASISDPDSASNIMFSFSTDGSETWSERVRINKVSGDLCSFAESTVLGAMPCVGSNGEVYVAWSSPQGIILDKSIDGGITWLENDITVTDLPGGFRYHVPGVYRCFGFPSLAFDYSSDFKGTLYISWSDQRSGTDNTDVWITSSTNEGESWSTPLKVNNDIGEKHQFFNWICVDQSTGYLYIVFYDRRNYDNESTDVYMASSTDGGRTFSNERISETPFKPESGTFMGDYTNIAAINGVIRPIWTRLDTSQLSVWTAIINEDK